MSISILPSPLTLYSLYGRYAPDQYENCTFATCDLSTSYWSYIPSLPVNAFFLSIFTLSFIISLLIPLLSPSPRRFPYRAYTFALSCTSLLEVIGYLGRVLSSSNPWHEIGFLLQIICLTIAPAFASAGIYLCLRRIVTVFGKENSRIRPESYTRIFVPCDIVSLVLQAAGGAMASEATHQGRSNATGDHIMVAGLAFQVFTLGVFMALCFDFALRTVKHSHRTDGSSLDTKSAAIRSSLKFRGFLSALALATVCIFVRSTYRVAELSEGWEGYLIKQQRLFIGLEGVMVLVAVLAMNIFHPAICFAEGGESSGGLGGFWGRRQNDDDEEKESESSA